MIRIGICDDVPEVCSQLEKIILDYQSQTTKKIETGMARRLFLLYNATNA